MNHDGELKVLGMAIKRTILAIQSDVNDVLSAKHRTELNKKLDLASHWAIKMSEELDDLNEWLTAFGPEEEQQDPFGGGDD